MAKHVRVRLHRRTGFPPDMALEPRFLGYSIGKWLDTDGDGRYDTLAPRKGAFQHSCFAQPSRTGP
jgi:hypothetical protein